MLLALSGYGGVGKDSLADALIEEHGFMKYAWADTLRIAAGIMNPIVGIYLDGELVNDYYSLERVGYSSIRIVRYNDALEEDGYTAAKAKYPLFREFLQLLGTDVGRNLISDDVWVDATIARIARDGNMSDDIVLTDTRFPNEADAVRQRGGYVVRMIREGVGPVNNHPSETSLDDYHFDSTLYNNGTLAGLSVLATSLVEFLRNSPVGLASSSPY